MSQQEHIKRFGPVPTNLAGFQLLCGSTVQAGDLCVWGDVMEWAAGLIGFATDDNGHPERGHSCRIYRRSSPPSHEGRTDDTSLPHHSVALLKGAAARSLADSAASERKQIPIATGCIDYFPDALAAVAHLSFIGNQQHNPGKPLHWDRAKSRDDADALMRHFVQRGTQDGDGMRHSAKVAWRALAMLQRELEAEGAAS